MKKRMELDEEEKNAEQARQTERLLQQQRKDDKFEMDQTNASKKLVSSMAESARENSVETLQKVVEVLQNQNVNFLVLKL